jgi:hypothetical protein
MHITPFRKLLFFALAVVVLAYGMGLAAPTEVAEPPEFTDADVEPFFEDAREELVGERPADDFGADEAATGRNADDAAESFAWSRIIDGESLATEVKRSAARLLAPLATATAFKQGGNNACSAEFALLAVLFAVIDEFDGEVRWQRDAAALRQSMAAAAEACREATDDSYALAVERRTELDELIRGGRTSGAGEPLDKWSTLADRRLLMQRIEVGLQEGINPRVANERELSRGAAAVRHEAQMLAILAEVIHREEFEFWDDETFGDYARELGEAADELSRAATEANYEAARAAAGRVGQACVACHDGYRG